MSPSSSFNPPPSSSFVVAFDLDGTLFTSESIIAGCYHEVVADLNHRAGLSLVPPSASSILRYVGQPGLKIAASLYPDLNPQLREDLADAALHALTRRIRLGEGRLIEGALDTLSELRDRGYPLLLVSNCRREYLEAILDTYQLASFFESAMCNADDPEAGKAGILRRLAAGRRGVMVGDRSSDGEAARHAQLRWIACRYGYAEHGDGEQNELMGADAVVRSLSEVPPLVVSFASSMTEPAGSR